MHRTVYAESRYPDKVTSCKDRSISSRRYSSVDRDRQVASLTCHSNRTQTLTSGDTWEYKVPEERERETEREREEHGQ